VRALAGFEAQVHHRIGPNRQWLRTDSGQPARAAPARALMQRCSVCRCGTPRRSETDCH
jgi:hypothetical protein